MSHESDLNAEYERRQLIRMGAAERILRIDHAALIFLIKQRQLRPEEFDWKGRRKCGIPRSQLENVEAVFRNGVIRLMRVSRHADHEPGIICRPAGNGLCEPLNAVGQQP